MEGKTTTIFISQIYYLLNTLCLKRHTAMKGHSSAMTALSILHSLMILLEQENIPGTIIVRK